jgi:hypothetical protein
MKLMSEVHEHAQRAISGVVLGGYVLLTSVMLLYLRDHPSLASSTDVEAYIGYAARIRQSGLAADFGNIRTYGYPALLALLSHLVQLENLSLGAGLLQAILYGCGAFWTTQKLARRSRLFSLSVLCGLLLNPYLVSVVVDAVSDAPSLISMVFLSGLILKLQSTGRLCHRDACFAFLVYFAAGTAIACFSVMIRPSNVLLVAAWLSGVGWHLAFREDDFGSKARLAGAALVILVLLAFVFWSPQYFYNVRWYGRASIFPTCPIGTLQLTYGLVTLKYETVIVDHAAVPLYYPNPWFTGGGLPSGPAWTWYLLHPFNGVATIAGHLFAAFTIDHLFAYRYHGASEPLLVPVLEWALTGCGILTIGAAVRGKKWKSRDDAPLWAYTGVIAAGSILFCMGTAVETRMALFPIAAMSIAGLYGIFSAVRCPQMRGTVIGASLLAGLAGMAVTTGLRSLETKKLELPSRDFARLDFPCYHAHPAQ